MEYLFLGGRNKPPWDYNEGKEVFILKSIEELKAEKMTAVKMKQILAGEYNIHNEAEFEKAIKESPGINMGIFTNPFHKKGEA
jgi:hypothetical protein